MSLTQGTMLDLTAILGEIGADIANIRTRRGLPPLVCPVSSPVAPLLMGDEQTWREMAPPRIVFVPTTIRNIPARNVGIQPAKGRVSQLPARPFGVRSSRSTSNSGAIRIRSVSTHCSTSTPAWSFTVSYSAPCIATSPRPRWSSGRLGGSSPRTTDVTGASSSSPSPSPRTSRTSRSRSYPSRASVSQVRACRSTWTWCSSPRTGKAARIRARSSRTFLHLPEAL